MKEQVLRWSDREALDRVASALKQGKVVAGSSDTVLGLLADTTQKGFLALNTLKMRTEKPYLILIASAHNINHFVDSLPQDAKLLIDSCWPGPLTLIVQAKKGLPYTMVSAQGTIAVRVPSHEGLQALLPHFEGLFSTSANLSGQPIPSHLDDLEVSLKEQVAYLITDDEALEKTSLASTLVDCTGELPLIIREGAYSRASLETIVGKKL